ILAENPELWEWVEQRWARVTAGFGGGYDAAQPQSAQPQSAQSQSAQSQSAGSRAAADVDEQYDLYRRLSKRRLEALAVARAMNVTEVEASAVEAFEPEELRHVS